MKLIDRFEFIENDQGELALVIETVSLEALSEDAVLLVSREANTAYLHRSANDVSGFRLINEKFTRKLRNAQMITVIEIQDDNVTHTYDAQVGYLEEDSEDAGEESSEIEDLPAPEDSKN